MCSKPVFFLHIEGKTNFSILPRATEYDVYLIFKTAMNWTGLDTVLRASVKLINTDVNVTREVRLKGNAQQTPWSGDDRWMELKLGQFICDDNTRDQEVVVTLEDPKNKPELEAGLEGKKGLIIAGIELRPV
jgi:Phloem protein 2